MLANVITQAYATTIINGEDTVALSEESLNTLNAVINTEEDQAAFNAGYELGKDPAFHARLEGPVTAQWYGGVVVALQEKDNPKTPWLSERVLPRGMGDVFVDNPAFVLGSVVAALEGKLAPAISEA
ncbi:MAG: hypothetical protein JWN38_485 [Candidatus Saccharibacteria bacterium]|nr:hypothetical protein [Candidatus Saccharibacteria bacterium]